MDYLTYFKIILFLWKLRVVDTFTAAHLIYNLGSQYGGIVLSAMADGNLTKFRNVMLEPVIGLGVACKFITVAQTQVERQKRIATVAFYLGSSAMTATHSSANTNVAIGAAISCQINDMRKSIEARGGGFQIKRVTSELIDLKSFTLDPLTNSIVDIDISTHQIEFTRNSQIIIKNIFSEHSHRRYVKGSAQKLRTTSSNYLVPVASASVINTSTCTVIGWTCLGICGFSLLTLGGLYLFQLSKKARWEKEHVDNSKIIDH